jgi:hypothetical protein
MRNKVISRWILPALYVLAQRPSDSAACRWREGFRRYAVERGLEKAWYVITIEGFQIKSETMVYSMIRRPFDMTEPYYFEFPNILATAAGQPPGDPITDFHQGQGRRHPQPSFGCRSARCARRTQDARWPPRRGHGSVGRIGPAGQFRSSHRAEGDFARGSQASSSAASVETVGALSQTV